jgi:hypothetical protein
METMETCLQSSYFTGDLNRVRFGLKQKEIKIIMQFMQVIQYDRTLENDTGIDNDISSAAKIKLKVKKKFTQSPKHLKKLKLTA